MTTRAEQKEATRRTLLDVGRRLFAGRGYAAVGLSDIVGAAAVTKGALYHHFDSKADLFRAVLAAVQERVAETVAATAGVHDDPWDQLVEGCRAFLTASTDPAVRQIMLIDGPAVIGWTEWRSMDEATSASQLADALMTLMDDGTIPPQPIGPVTHLLSGAMNEAALWLASSGGPNDLDDTMAVLIRMLDALRSA